MTRHTCHDCGDAIPNGTAHIRSSMFVQVAYCGGCWAVRQIAHVLERVA
jgi:hypothetical protein